MRRREFITLLCSTGATWPLAVRAQQPAMPVIGWFSTGVSQEVLPHQAAFRKALNEAGFVEGRNVTIEFHRADGESHRLPAAAELVRSGVTVILVEETSLVPAAKAATAAIPIVFVTGADPVALGFVASLNRPGGNITGVSFLNSGLGPKKLELLQQAAPNAAVIGFLVNPTTAYAERNAAELRGAARSLGVEIRVLNARNEAEIEAAFETLRQQHIGALLIDGGGFFTNQYAQLAALAARHNMPAMYSVRDFATAGGLMTFGAASTDAYRIAAGYVGRILKGEKPGDLPVQQSTKVELVINMKTAKQLGLTIPLTLRALANEVIE